MLAVGRPMIAWLKNLKGMKWSPREDTPDSHLQKAGTPSMGGIGIVGAAVLSWVAMSLALQIFGVLAPMRFAPFGVAENINILGFVVLVVLHAVLGFADDWSKARGKGGLLARQKLLGQVLLALAFLIFWVASSDSAPFTVSPIWFRIALFAFLLAIVIGTSNAVNLTDGIDGLAAGLSVQVAFAFLISMWHEPLNTASLNGAGSIFWICLGGACLGFLAFNKYPAKVFMGDTGSLALGAALGAGAILTRTVWLLPFIGFIFFVEMFSVIFQVLYFKWTKKRTGEGKRIFRRAPLHHHFELGGWSEWRVVGTFWLVNLFTSAIGLALWKMGILPRFP